MSAAPSATLVKGWCPGALRPMLSGDGLIVRLRISCGETPLKLARDIAEWARAYGNGAIDLSARGNLQLRGVSEATLPPLSAELADAGLLDEAPEAEAVRNVVVSPFAGLDPAAPCDVRVVARAWEAELSQNRALWSLARQILRKLRRRRVSARRRCGLDVLGRCARCVCRPPRRRDGSCARAFRRRPARRAWRPTLAQAFLAQRESPACRMRDAVARTRRRAVRARGGTCARPRRPRPPRRPRKLDRRTRAGRGRLRRLRPAVRAHRGRRSRRPGEASSKRPAGRRCGSPPGGALSHPCPRARPPAASRRPRARST